MKQLKTIGLITATALVLFSCGGSKKDGAAALNDLKAKLEKEKKERTDNETAIKQLEAEILKLDTNAASAAKVKLVSVAPVTAQPFEHYIDLLGRVDADNISYIAPRSTGMSAGGVVKAVYIKEGQLVKKGQLVLKLDDAIIRQQIEVAKKGVEGIKTQLAFAKNIYQRQKNLWDQGIGTEVQLISAKNSVEAYENQLVSANEAVKTTMEQLNTSNVYSDVTGIADEVNIHVGEMFMGGTAIKIVNKSSLKVVTNVPENYLTRIHTGIPVLINIPDAGKTGIPSSVSLISQSVDPTLRGFTAEAKIPADGTLKPNQTAIMKIKDYSAASAIVIPVNMVQTDESGKYVYVMISGGNGKTVAHKMPVVIGEIYGDKVEIKGGLKGGEQLITEGYQTMYEGQLVSAVK